MFRKIFLSLLIFAFMSSIGEAADLSGKTQLKDLRYSIGSGTVRIVLDLNKRVDFSESYAENPSRLIVSLKNTWIDVKTMKRDIELNSTAAKRIKVAQYDASTVRIVVETMANIKIFWLNGGPSGQRLVIDVGNVPFKPAPEVKTPPKETPPPEDENLDDYNENPYFGDAYKDDNKSSDGNKKSTDGKKSASDDKKSTDGKKSAADDKKSTDGKKSAADDKKSTDGKKTAADDKKSTDGKKTTADDKKSTDGNKTTDGKKPGKKTGEPVSELDKDLDELMELEGKTIVLDAGHGGGDAGAIGPTGVTEKSVTLRVALELRDLLENAGAKVIMTRTTDRQVSAKGDKASAIEELQARCAVANKSGADIFISIHADSFTNPNARGTTGYYFAQSASGKGKKLAECIRKALCEQLRTPSRGTKPCNFYVVRHTDMPATLIELAFISNPEEEELLDSDEGVTKAAQGIFDGIEDYFG